MMVTRSGHMDNHETAGIFTEAPKWRLGLFGAHSNCYRLSPLLPACRPAPSARPWDFNMTVDGTIRTPVFEQANPTARTVTIVQTTPTPATESQRIRAPL